MKLCLNTDCLPDLALGEVLDFAASLGIMAVEIAAGGQSPAPHLNLAALLSEPAKRTAFAAEISSREMRLAAINCSAWPLHPVQGDSNLAVIKQSIRLAGELGVDKIVTMSGCPGDSDHARTINWIFFPWPPETRPIREKQWAQAIDTWHSLVSFALEHGVRRIALELHPLQLVYNVPTMGRLRDAVGPVIGANIDPSHMFWQQMDAARVVAALGDAVFHVHLKDTQIFGDQVAVNGVLDPRSWEDPDNRSWVFRTIGEGQPPSVWTAFLKSLQAVGYDDVLSIENEDLLLPGKDGVRRAVSFLNSIADSGQFPSLGPRDNPV